MSYSRKRSRSRSHSRGRRIQSMVKYPAYAGGQAYHSRGRTYHGPSSGMKQSVPSNSLIRSRSRSHTAAGSQNALFGSTHDGVVITNSEYVQDVVTDASANTFSLNTLKINPGDPESFPWLSAVAACFQEYEFLGLVFEFRTMSADALSSANTALGQVIMGVEYNALQPAPTTKQAIEQLMGSISVKPSSNARCAIECKRKRNPLGTLYIRNSGNATNEDIRFEDMGYICIATNGMQGTSVNVGEIWVHYIVKLKKQIIPQAVGPSSQLILQYAHYAGIGSTDALDQSASHPFGHLLTPGGPFGTASVDNGFANYTDTIGGHWCTAGNTDPSQAFVPRQYYFPDAAVGQNVMFLIFWNSIDGVPGKFLTPTITAQGSAALSGAWINSNSIADGPPQFNQDVLAAAPTDPGGTLPTWLGCSASFLVDVNAHGDSLLIGLDGEFDQPCSFDIYMFQYKRLAF